MKKTTIKDVAKAVGCSTATVSYVLNDREDQKISQSTKKKVLQIANLLNYSPNISARSLSTNRSGNITVLTSRNGLITLGNAMCFLRAFAKRLQMSDYRLMYNLSDNPRRLDNTDAVVCFGMSSEDFYAWGDQNLIPLIAYDSIIKNQQLFFQVIPDFAKIKQAADAHFGGHSYRYVLPANDNSEFVGHVLSHFPDAIFAETNADLDRAGTHILLTNPVLFDSFGATAHILRYTEHLSQALDALVACIEDATSHAEKDQHLIEV